LLGLKLSGFLLNAFIVVVCLAIFWHRWPVDLSNGFDASCLPPPERSADKVRTRHLRVELRRAVE
jgi:hypothetical protein